VTGCPLITYSERTSRDTASATERPATPAAAKSGVIDRDDGEDRIVAPLLKLTRGAARDAIRRTLEANIMVGGMWFCSLWVQFGWLVRGGSRTSPQGLQIPKSMGK
jgi:hypothetical protein